MSSRDIDESSENVLSEWSKRAELEPDPDDGGLEPTDDDGPPAWGTAAVLEADDGEDAGALDQVSDQTVATMKSPGKTTYHGVTRM